MNGFKELMGKRVCVAVSGGVDSTALLHYLKDRAKTEKFSLSAVHCEHGIRGEESLADQKFVEKLCADWDIPLFVFREDCVQKAQIEKSSLETAARNFRYACFKRLVSENKAEKIATAHHVSDEAETVLFRLARGTLSGARGMESACDWLVRPFLSWTKEEILEYAKKNGLTWREDATNFQTDATRNKLRWKVFPALEEAVPGAKENLARFAALIAQDDEFLYEESRKLLFRGESGEYGVAFCVKRPLFTRACLTTMKTLGIERDYTSLHLEILFLLQGLERGSCVDLPKGVQAKKMEQGILFYKKQEISQSEKELPAEEKPFDLSGFDGGRYAVSVSLKMPLDAEFGNVLRLDMDRLPKDAVFRFRKEGDEIEKFGGGRKTLKKFFNEKKIPVEERAFLPLIADSEGKEVYAVCGVEIAEKVKVTAETENAVYLLLRKK